MSLIRRLQKQLAKIKSIAQLSTASYAASIVALLTSLILTRVMSPQDFGAYRYIVVVIGFMAVVSHIGLPYSSAHLLTKKDGDGKARTIAASLQLLTASVAIATVLLALIATIVRNLTDVSVLLMLASGLIWTTAFQRHFQYMLRGAGAVGGMVLQTILPASIILPLAAALGSLKLEISLAVILAIFGGAYLITHLVTAFRAQVWKVRHLQSARTELLTTQKSVGFPIYKGALISVGAAELVLVVGGAYVGEVEFGFYSLAMSLSGPVATLPTVIAMVQFRKFGSLKKLRPLTFLVTVLYSSVAGVIGVGLGWLLFPFLYPNDFETAKLIFPLLSVGFLVHGLGDYLNQFLQAQGRGLQLKRVSYIVGIANVAIAMVVIPLLGVWGLAVTRVLGSMTYLFAMVYLIFWKKAN